MKKMKYLLLLLAMFLTIPMYSQPWKPAGDQIKTVWAEQVNPQNPLPEYPRPILVRSEWQNLRRGNQCLHHRAG